MADIAPIKPYTHMRGWSGKAGFPLLLYFRAVSQ